MPANDQDARALTYLARRIRTETHGAAQWDEAGTWAVVSKLIGQNLALAIERVTRHAADPGARTPGAINRPFVPDAATGSTTTRPEPVPKHLRCTVCSEHRDRCRQLWAEDHDFDPPADRKLPPDAIANVVTELRGHLAPMKPPAPPREFTPDPTHPAARARAALSPDAGDDTLEETPDE